MAKPNRLDAELVRRGLASSRAEAKDAVESGRVLVAGVPVTKAASMVSPASAVELKGSGPRFVSRGGDKLDHALGGLQVEVAGRDWLDAGASTGGFTDRLLQGGARRVVAVDVGYGQFDWTLRNDPRVEVIERTNVRNLSAGDLPFVPDGVVADLSFISLRTVLPSLQAVAGTHADFVLLVKPQFEAGREAVSKGGVVRDPHAWADSLRAVRDSAAALGLGLAGVVLAEPPGPSGNREFFLHLRRGAQSPEDAIDEIVSRAAGATSR